MKEILKEKKIVYVTSTRLPTEKAHGIATMKMCEAFVKNGYNVNVISPMLWRKNEKDIFSYYGIKDRIFNIKKIPCVDLLYFNSFQKLTFFIQVLSFSIFVLFFVLLKYRKNIKDVIFFSHDHIPLFLLTFLPVNIFYDIHHFPGDNLFYKRVITHAKWFGVQTKWKIKALDEKFGVDEKKIVYWPNGVDLDKFTIDITKAEARRKLGLPLDKKIILYTGLLFEWKGVDSLVRSSSFLDEDILIYIVGPSNQQVQKFKIEVSEINYKNIIFVEHQPFSMIPIWNKSADVLVLPNTAKMKVSLYYTSPMKLFEYMASERPIVASKIPSIMEILDESSCVFAEPDNPESFARSIELVLNDENLSRDITLNARKKSTKFTWDERVKKIVDFIENSNI